MKRANPTRRAHSQAGFTLLELMVALVAGLIAVSSIYTLSAASSHHFQEQQRISQTQMSVRMAMEQIALDVQRAGFLGTPNTRVEQRCVQPPGGLEFGAVAMIDGMDTANLPNAAANGVQADRLRLVGNYATSSRYVVDFAVGNRMRVDASTQGFRSTFGILGDDFDATSFEDVFRIGRYLHIADTDGDHFFVRITGVTGAAQEITFTPNLQNGAGSCASGSMRQSFVSPLSMIEYTVVNAGTPGVNLGTVFGTAAQQAVDAARGSTNSVLIRREVAFDGTPVANSERVVLEYASNFDVDIVADMEVGLGLPPNLNVLDDGAATAVLTANPHRVRTLQIDLAARTAEQSDRFPFVPRAAGAALTRYQTVPALPGAARVRSIQSEIFLPNIPVIRP